MMESGNCFDNIADGLTGDDVLEILNILDLPIEALEDDAFFANWDSNKAQCLGPLPSDFLMVPLLIAHGEIQTQPPKSFAPFKIDETPEQKQLLSFVKQDSSSHIQQHNKSSEIHTKSPISVLESSVTSSVGITHNKIHAQLPQSLHGPVAAIDKTPERKQLPSFIKQASGSHIQQYNKSAHIQELSLSRTKNSVSVSESSGPSSSNKSPHIKSDIAKPVETRSRRGRVIRQSTWLLSYTTYGKTSNSKNIKKESNYKELENSQHKSKKNKDESDYQELEDSQHKLKKNKKESNYQKLQDSHHQSKKNKKESDSEELEDSHHESKKCSHCEIRKTLQWRAGPLGAQTLCNACGMKYRSGCLFPEYRPAASPTFVASMHSNSHKRLYVF